MVSAEDKESLLLGVLGLTLLVAGIADQLKVSAAVGAFLVGIAVSGTVAESAVELLAPLRDVFAAVFFVTFGLSTSAGTLLPVLPLAPAADGRHVRRRRSRPATWRRGAARSSGRGRWRAGVALIPRGEFSVIIAALAVAAGVDARLGPLTAAYVLLTIVIAAAVQKLPDRLRSDVSGPKSRTPASTPQSAGQAASDRGDTAVSSPYQIRRAELDLQPALAGRHEHRLEGLAPTRR